MVRGEGRGRFETIMRRGGGGGGGSGEDIFDGDVWDVDVWDVDGESEGCYIGSRGKLHQREFGFIGIRLYL